MSRSWIDKIMVGLARYLALLGGAVLVALTLMTCLSIIGRAIGTLAYVPFVKEHLSGLSELIIKLNIGPIAGDFEIMEAGIAFCVFSFLPWCQINRAHASIDLVTSKLSKRLNKLIILVMEICLSAILFVIAWRLWVGMVDKMSYGETSFILQFPLWWAYALSVISAILAAIISAFMVWVSYREFTNNVTIKLIKSGASD